jgi:D-alanine transaminase
MSTCYCNGEYVSKEEAKVSPFDRGYLFGDGVYEVVPVISGKLVDKKYFFERLKYSLGELGIAHPFEENAELLEILTQLVASNNIVEGGVYLQVTRGVAFTRTFEFNDDMKPSFFAFGFSASVTQNPAFKTGIEVISTKDLRWKRRDVKSLQLLGQCMSKQDAVSRGAKEGWLIEEGFVSEGCSSSAFIVKNGVVVTRPLSNLILPGIRRRTLLEIIQQSGFGLEERLFTLEEAMEADEAFISSATNIVVSVVSIDGKPVGEGVPGEMTAKLRALYLSRLLEEVAASK